MIFLNYLEIQNIPNRRSIYKLALLKDLIPIVEVKPSKLVALHYSLVYIILAKISYKWAYLISRNVFLKEGLYIGVQKCKKLSILHFHDVFFTYHECIQAPNSHICMPLEKWWKNQDFWVQKTKILTIHKWHLKIICHLFWAYSSIQG